MADFKALKYKSLVHAFNLQVEAGDRLSGRALFVALVVSTLGQMHGFRPLADAVGASYARLIEDEGARHDGLGPDTLVPRLKTKLRQRILTAAARGFARSLRAAGRPYTGDRQRADIAAVMA